MFENLDLYITVYLWHNISYSTKQADYLAISGFCCVWVIRILHTYVFFQFSCMIMIYYLKI